MSISNLRLMTLNIAHGRGLSTYQGFHNAKGIERSLNRIAHLLRRAKPDIVALQEVDEDSHWNKRIHLLEYLQEAANYPHSQIGINTRREGRLPLVYGNGVLSKLPIEHADNQAFGNATLGEKGFLYTEYTLYSEDGRTCPSYYPIHGLDFELQSAPLPCAKGLRERPLPCVN